MKWLTLSLTLAAALPLTAGVRLEMQETDLSNNKTTTTELLVESTRFRINMGDDTSVMFLTDGGRRLLMYDKKRNEVREMDQATMDQLAAQMGGMMAQLEAQMAKMPPEQRAMMERMMKGKMPQAAAPKRVQTVYTRSGTSTVNGFSCLEYDGMQGNDRVVALCAAAPAALKMSPADFAVFEEMRQFVSKLTDTLASSPMIASVMADPITDPGVDGFPVERVTYSNGKATRRSEVKSVTEVSFTDADFSTGNAKKVDMIPPGALQGR